LENEIKFEEDRVVSLFEGKLDAVLEWGGVSRAEDVPVGAQRHRQRAAPLLCVHKAEETLVVETCLESGRVGGLEGGSKSEGLGVVVDMAYRPAETPLLKLAKEAGGRWALVPGLEVLLQQGYEQFRLWTGRSCPKGLVAIKVREGYNNQT